MDANILMEEREKMLTSGNSLNIASSAAAFALNILDGDDKDAPKQDTCINLMIPPCSLAICEVFRNTLLLSHHKYNFSL